MFPNPTDLRYFLESAQTGNLSRAAERLGIAQPSLTVAIQRLEHAVGTPLLVRSPKGVHLTFAGRQLYQHARSLMTEWEKVRIVARATVNTLQGRYSLGCHPSVALYSLASFLPALAEEFPELELALIHDLSRNITEQVISCQIDIGIVINPVRHPDLVIQKICDDVVQVWSNGQSRRVLDYINGTAVIICDPTLLQTQIILEKMKRAKIAFQRIITSSSLEVIARLAIEGAGLGILPARVVQGFGENKLRAINASPFFRDTLALVYRQENKTNPAFKFLTRFILDHMRGFSKDTASSTNEASNTHRRTKHHSSEQSVEKIPLL